MSGSIPWALLEKQYFNDKGYRMLKEKIEDLNLRLHSTDEFFLQNKNGPANLLTKFSNKNDLTNYNFLCNEKNQEIFHFMQLLMDECTHLLNFDKPIDASLVYAIAAQDDAYVLRDGVHHFDKIWPGNSIKFKKKKKKLF